MSETDHEGVSRRHALRLFLGQGAEIARERDRHALALDQEAALEGSRPAHDEPGSAPTGETAGGTDRAPS